MNIIKINYIVKILLDNSKEIIKLNSSKYFIYFALKFTKSFTI